MDAVSILLKYLKSKHYIDDIEKARTAVTSAQIDLRKEDDLFIRDAIMGLGTILKEDLEQHYYITTVKIGLFGNVLTQAIIKRNGVSADIAVHAREGLIKRGLADMTINKLRGILQ